MKKLLIFVPSLRGGGAEKVAINLSNTFAEDNDKTYLMFVKKNSLNLNHLNKKLNLINLNKTRLLFSIIPIIKFLFQNYKNLYVISFLNAPNLLFCLLKFFIRNMNFNLTITIHNCISESYKNSNFIGKLIILLMSYFCTYADKIICVSDFVKQDFKNNWNKRHKNIKTIYNPAINVNEIKKLSKKKNLFIEKYKNKNYKVVLAVGRLTEQKNYKLLINSFGKVVKKINKIILIILGSGDQKNMLMQMIKEQNLTKKIFIFNYQSNPYSFIKNSDLIVLSSNWEGLPTILIESLFLKKKILSTRCKGGCAEVLKNGKYGYLSPVNDIKLFAKNIIHALKNKKKRINNYFISNFIDKNVIKKYKFFIFKN